MRMRCIKFNVHGSVHRKNILIYVQHNATLHSLLYLETALHVLGGTSTYHQERIQLYLQHMVFVTPLTLTRLMSYIYAAPILDVSRSHTTTQHSR